MAVSKFSHVKITGIEYVIPNNICRNVDNYLHFFDNNPKKLERAKKMIGYGNIYKAPEGVTTSDLCEYAANNLIKNMNIERNEIDALIFVSQSPDYFAPPSSQVLHKKLDLSESCAVFDVTQGCTGYVYGLWLASSLIESRAAEKVLLCAGDNTYIDPELDQKGGSLLFSDAGCATLLEYSDNENLSSFYIGSKGKGFESIIYPAGRSRLPVSEKILKTVITDKDGNKWKLNEGFMDGLAVFDFTMNTVPAHIAGLLQSSGYNIDDIDFFGIHQANKQIVKTLAEKAGIPESKYSVDTFTKYGNHGGISCLSNLIDNYADIIQKEKSRAALISFGTGLSWASVIFDIGQIYCSGIKLAHFDAVRTFDEEFEYWKNKIENYSASK